MTKKKVTKLEIEIPITVLGIASNDKVWKVCWKINQQLETKLASRADSSVLAESETYVDFESDPDFDFLLIENAFQGRKVTRLAKKFRFWLVIKQKRDAKADIKSLLSSLSQIDIISLALDLSTEKDIKKLLP